MIALLALAAIFTVNTLRLKAEPLAPRPAPAPTDAAAVARLSQAIRIPIISSEAGPPSPQALAAFHSFLDARFPRVHAELTRETVGAGSLLYTWTGTDPNVPALLLTAHQDSVPVEPGTSGKWSLPPFSGAVANGFVWGRGTLDDKGSLMAILEATERLLARGYRPRQTIYLAFGHNEEIGGKGGAEAIAALLRQRAARIALALDEGSAVLDGVIAGVKPPVAMIGVAEKGYVSVEVAAAGSGGHSSQPGDDNAAVRIVRAVARIEDSGMPVHINEPVDGLLDAIAPHTGGMMRVTLANRWLTEPLVKRQLLASPTSAAALRTTTALTILHAGTKDNVMPQRARAVVNHRIMPGETIGNVVAHDRAAVNDPSVSVRALPGGFDPGPTVSADSPQYRRLAAVIRSSFPNAVVAPGMVVAATDLRHYRQVADASFRFMPFTLTPNDLARIHGNNERIGIADYMRAIQFYERLMTSSPPPDSSAARPR